MTRDNKLWPLFLLASALGYVASHFGRFPFIPAEYQGVIELLSFVASTASAMFGMSPLPKSGTDDKIDVGKMLGL